MRWIGLGYTERVMALPISRIRRWFAVLALIAVAVVAGFYVRARLEMRRALRHLPEKVGVNIQQTSEGFTLSKSEGGRTLFTVHAAKATQFKQGGRAALHDVRIIVYGRTPDRFDQIYGSDFEYDPAEAKVVSKGEVQIDLGGATSPLLHPSAPALGAPGIPPSTPGGSGAPSAAENGENLEALHLRLEGMTFDQKTGVAESRGRVEFRLPEAAGSARGATYDSRRNELRLASEIDVKTQGRQPTHLVARSGLITKEPRQLSLEGVQISSAGRELQAEHGVAHLAPDNAVQRVTATGNVRLSDVAGLRLQAPRGELLFGSPPQHANSRRAGDPGGSLESAWLGGGVEFESGQQAANGHAGEIRILFSSRATKPVPGGCGVGRSSGLQTIYASQGVVLRQAGREGGRNPQALTMSSNAMTFGVERAGPISDPTSASRGQMWATRNMSKSAARLSWARTEGPGELTIRSADPKRAGEETVINARGFTADFGEEGRLRAMRGEGAVQVVSRAAGEPDRVSTSERLVAEFSPSGELLRAVQEGDFRYREDSSARNAKNEPGGRLATAARASYSPADESLALTGGPRVVDGGMTVEANSLRVLRRSGELSATGNVKTTYSQLSMQASGALLAAGDPVHVTAQTMNVKRDLAGKSGMARYSGGARLWQGSNVVQAQTIDFDEKERTLVASGDEKRPVTSVFLQVDGKGRSSTILVTAQRLSYEDNQRQAHYTGGVTAKGADGVMTAVRADILLKPSQVSAKEGAGPGPPSSAVAPSQLERIVAGGHVVVQQKERRVEGDKLVYEASSGVFRMTGGPPVLSDPVNGTVRGDSLTFYSRDDTVIVEGGDASRAVTRTHVSR